MTFEAGQRWAYRAPDEIADSRIHIGAIVEFSGGVTIACCAVTGAQQDASSGGLERATIPFLPLSLEALAKTVTARDGDAECPEEFAAALEAWGQDPRGVSYYTVPFEGSLERLIGLQMAAIVGQS